MTANDRIGGEPLPELPALDSGLHLLDAPSRQPDVLQALTVDHLLVTGGSALWVDANGHARTDSLARLAPSGRILDNVRIARGFTPHQHYSLVSNASEAVDSETELVVAPHVDAFYRADEAGTEGERMFLTTLATLARIARTHDIPVLVTRSRADKFAAPVVTAAAETIRCEQTRFGPRLSVDGNSFETQLYPVGGGLMQTTFAFWQRVLEARTPLYEQSPNAAPEPEVARGTN